MSNYYLCETCAVKHIGGEMQSFIPFFSCSAKPTSMAGMIPIADGEIPREVCPYYEPKIMKESWVNDRVHYRLGYKSRD